MTRKSLSFLILSLILLGCGTQKKRPAISNADKAKRLKKTFAPVNAGPSIKSSQFVDISQEVGLGSQVATRFYVYDLNGDDKEDLIILPEFYSSPKFFIRTKTGFRPAKNVYFDKPVKASFLNIDDFNKDGVVDILVAVHNQRTELTKTPIQMYKGSKVRGNIVFKQDNAYKFKGRNPVTSIATFDHDSNGQLDFYVGNWFDKTKSNSNQLVQDRLYTFKNNQLHDISGALKKVSKVENLAPTYGVSHCDVDGDGRTDILTSSSAGYLNKLWFQEREKGIFTYTNLGRESGFAQDREGELIPKGGGNSTYSLCADYNNDGIMDLVVGEISHSFDSETRDRSSILTGEGLGFPPTFIRNEYISDQGIDNWNQGDQRANWLDINNDGLIDLLVENSGFPPHTRMILFVQESDHAYADQAKPLGIDIVNPVGATYLDYNGDGKLDLLVSQTNIRDKKIKPKLYLFENRMKNTGKHIRFKLIGKNSNKNAIGAKVILRTKDGREQMRWHQVNSGPFPSQNSGVLHFGLGSSEVEELEVHWPFEKKGIKLIQTFRPPFLYSNGFVKIKEY
jgi:hypothetical protein